MAKVTRDTAGYAIAVGRILVGWLCLWAFLDKLFGLGFATLASRSWLSGGSPTTGFLKSTHGPLAGIFHSLAGSGWVDWLFMAALLGLGLALITGVALRLAAVAGTLLFASMWLASLPIKDNPFVDDHWFYIVILWAAALGEPKLSLSGVWRKLPFVRKNRWLW